MRIGDVMNQHKRISSIKLIKNEKLQKTIMLLLTFSILFIISSVEIIHQRYDFMKIPLLVYIGIALLILIIILIIFLYLYNFKRKIYESNSELLLISLILIFGSIICFGTNIISGYLIPVSFISILLAIIYEPLTSFAISIPFAGVILCLTNFNPDKAIIYVIGCLTGILFTRNVSVRNNIVVGGLLIGFLNGLTVLAFQLINNFNLLNSLINCGMALAGGVLSSIFALGFLPIFEQMFDIITPIRLLEISNSNQPLLKKMLFESPGTYHHSILVGNLSEAAAEEIGANSLLARVGAYYHDIGKIKRPYFFKENQINNDNPHDKITPKLSTIIITSHVKDGLELAEKYKLPKPIKNIIGEHHGDSLVKYFYNLAQVDDCEDIDESFFRYIGPKPTTKESGIIMMADSVEAGVRSLIKPTLGDIDKMVTKIIKDKIDDGQMSNCDLTMRDLDEIKKSFIKVLGGMFHNRIEYPEINENTTAEEILK